MMPSSKVVPITAEPPRIDSFQKARMPRYDSRRLGDALRRSREAAGKTQDEVAGIAKIKDPGTVSRWERGTQRVSQRNLGDVEDFIRQHHPENGKKALRLAQTRLGD
jgi:hypothetical protein